MVYRAVRLYEAKKDAQGIFKLLAKHLFNQKTIDRITNITNINFFQKDDEKFINDGEKLLKRI